METSTQSALPVPLSRLVHRLFAVSVVMNRPSISSNLLGVYNATSIQEAKGFGIEAAQEAYPDSAVGGVFAVEIPHDLMREILSMNDQVVAPPPQDSDSK